MLEGVHVEQLPRGREERESSEREKERRAGSLEGVNEGKRHSGVSKGVRLESSIRASKLRVSNRLPPCRPRRHSPLRSTCACGPPPC